MAKVGATLLVRSKLQVGQVEATRIEKRRTDLKVRPYFSIFWPFLRLILSLSKNLGGNTFSAHSEPVEESAWQRLRSLIR
jgi:hypothetical protein